VTGAFLTCGTSIERIVGGRPGDRALVDALPLRRSPTMVSVPWDHSTLRSACWDAIRDRRLLSQSAMLRPGLPKPTRRPRQPGHQESPPSASASGDDGALLDPLPKRPPGMRRETYRRLCVEADAATELSLALGVAKVLGWPPSPTVGAVPSALSVIVNEPDWAGRMITRAITERRFRHRCKRE